MKRELSSIEKEAIILLNAQGKSDGEIGKAIGRPVNTIFSFRQKQGLPANAKSPRPQGSGGIDYRKVLNPGEQGDMDSFLRFLTTAARKARELGVKPDVERVIKVWKEGGQAL